MFTPRLSKDSNGLNPSTGTPPRVAHWEALNQSKCAPKRKACANKKCMFYMEKLERFNVNACAWRVYATVCARTDVTTCLPVLRRPRDWGPLVRSKQAVFLFWANQRFGMSCHSRRIGQEHSGRLKLGLLDLPAAVYKAHLRVLKSVFVGRLRCTKDEPPGRFSLSVIWWRNFGA